MKNSKIAKMQRYILAFIAVVLFSFTSVTPASAHPSFSVCYDVANGDGDWLPSACNGKLVTPLVNNPPDPAVAGVFGLGVELRSINGVNVNYTAWDETGASFTDKNGGRVGGAADPLTAVSISLAPKGNRNICYTIVDENYKQSDGCNGKTVGQKAAGGPAITSILITVTG